MARPLSTGNQRWTLTVTGGNNKTFIFSDWDSVEVPDGGIEVGRIQPAGRSGDVVIPGTHQQGGTLTLSKPYTPARTGTELTQLRGLVGREVAASGRLVDRDGNDDGPGDQRTGVLVRARISDFTSGAVEGLMLMAVIETDGESA